MAASNGLSGFGVTISTATASTGSWTQLAVEIQDCSGPDITVDDIELTHTESPNGYKEFTPGLGDGGNSQLTLNYAKAISTSVEALVGVTAWYKISHADTANFICKGYVNAWGHARPHNDRMTQTLGIKWTGKPDYSTT